MASENLPIDSNQYNRITMQIVIVSLTAAVFLLIGRESNRILTPAPAQQPAKTVTPDSSVVGGGEGAAARHPSPPFSKGQQQPIFRATADHRPTPLPDDGYETVEPRNKYLLGRQLTIVVDCNHAPQPPPDVNPSPKPGPKILPVPDPGPTPLPAPTPAPTPTPVIRAKSVSIAIIEDGGNRSMEVAELFLDFTAWEALADSGVTWVRYDLRDGVPIAEMAKASLKACGVVVDRSTVGFVVYNRETKAVLYAGRLTGLDDVRERVSEITGVQLK